jgi:hypothetical protein
MTARQSSANPFRRFTGIAVIAVMVLRLWDIPFHATVRFVAENSGDIWRQFLACVVMQFTLALPRLFPSANVARKRNKELRTSNG